MLSLDGGGMKGIFSAAVLTMIEEDFGVHVTDHFDLIAGTSTGGILALGLAAGMRPRELLNMYITHQRDIFSSRGRRGRGVFKARYSNEGLRSVLASVLGVKLLSESAVRLVIPAFNLDANDVYVFRTPHHERLRRDWKAPMVDVAMATSAAPTFFPGYRYEALRLVDGGVWANNPSMSALVEAAETCGVPLERIRMLSIGTTSELKQRGAGLDTGGGLAWARRMDIVDVLMTGQSLAARNHCQLLLGKERFVRLDPLVPDSLFKLDHVDSESLISLAKSYSRTAMPELAEFAQHTPDPYKPRYTSGDTNE